MSENITKLRKNASDLGLKGAETISEDQIKEAIEQFVKDLKGKISDFSQLLSSLLKDQNESVEKKRRGIIEAMQRDEQKAEKQDIQPTEIVESRLADFERIKLLGTGNFSVEQV